MSGSARSPITPSAYRCTTRREAPSTTQVHILRLQPHRPKAGSDQAEALVSAQAVWPRPRLQRRSALQRPALAESWCAVQHDVVRDCICTALHCFAYISNLACFAMLGPSIQGSWAVLARGECSDADKLSERHIEPRLLQEIRITKPCTAGPCKNTYRLQDNVPSGHLMRRGSTS